MHARGSRRSGNRSDNRCHHFQWWFRVRIGSARVPGHIDSAPLKVVAPMKGCRSRVVPRSRCALVAAEGEALATVDGEHRSLGIRSAPPSAERSDDPLRLSFCYHARQENPMIFLTPDAWRARCAEVDVAADRRDRAPWTAVPVNASTLPNARLHVLADLVAGFAAEPAVAQAHGFLRVYEWGIFESSDRRTLYQCLRARHGNFDSIEASPGHEFLGHERAELAAVIECAVLNAWGITVEFATARRAVAIDHDGHIAIWDERGEAEAAAAAEAMARAAPGRA